MQKFVEFFLLENFFACTALIGTLTFTFQQFQMYLRLNKKKNGENHNEKWEKIVVKLSVEFNKLVCFLS